jgi:hypothetical protein
MFEIGQQVHVNAKKAIILAIETNKRGKTLYTVDDGARVFKTQQIDEPIVFAAPVSLNEVLKDHLAENRRSRVRNGSAW